MSISVNLAGSGPSWNQDPNPPLAAGRAAELASLAAVESLLTGLEPGTGVEPTPVPDAAGAAAQRQVSAQAAAPGLPELSAGPAAVRALGGKNSLAMHEDWFESSQPVKTTFGAGALELADAAQSIHTSLNLSSRLDPSRPLEGLVAGAVDPGRQLRSNQVDFETVPVQILSGEAKAAAVVAHTALGGHHPNWPRNQSGDQLMREIPLLFAPVPVEPQQTPPHICFKAVLVNGMLLVAAVLGAILVGTLNLRNLPSLENIELAAAVLVLLGVLYLIFRWARPRQA